MMLKNRQDELDQDEIAVWKQLNSWRREKINWKTLQNVSMKGVAQKFRAGREQGAPCEHCTSERSQLLILIPSGDSYSIEMF